VNKNETIATSLVPRESTSVKTREPPTYVRSARALHAAAIWIERMRTFHRQGRRGKGGHYSQVNTVRGDNNIIHSDNDYYTNSRFKIWF
jgi:hypothetical protein